MFVIVADDNDGSEASDRDPVGTKTYRVRTAIHRHFLTDDTDEEIAEDLGVSTRTIQKYVHSPPAEEARELLQDQAVTTRIAAWEELKRQLREAGERSRTAEKPIKIWPDDGEVRFTDVRNEAGEILERIPIPEGFEMGADEEARFYGRHEAREIIELMADLTGAGEPETIRLEGDLGVEHSGEVEASLSIGFEPTPREEVDDGE